MILLNPVVISVVFMTILCLLKFNIILAIIISSILTGFLVGMPIQTAMSYFIYGMHRHNNIALSYILLGALAYGIQTTGLAAKFANLLDRLFSKSGNWFIIILALIASLSQNVIPIHIAFIPILVPPLLSMMNKMQIDRRSAASALTFGLKAPYILIPAGFGLIFHNILATNITNNSAGELAVTASDIWPQMTWPFAGMVIGLFISVFITYRKPRVYEDRQIAGLTEDDGKGFTLKHWGALLGAIATFIVQILAGIFTEGSPLWALSVGAVVGLIIMIATGAIPYKKMDETIKGGIGLMGFIAFIMLTAAGYAEIIRESGYITVLVDSTMEIIGGNLILAMIAMQLIGLLITMGIGTSFGTIPIIATVFVPLCIALGLSPAATILMIATAGATGDAGMPASDTALGPTAGLAADGQHDHIWDTCIPTFFHYNIPLKVLGVVGALILS
ncbi:MAG: sodium:proton antiporter [Defluviitaleaceae bacterium]|nr:sodium:proton antiporter [Defluviitaleaceae bacterium]